MFDFMLSQSTSDIYAEITILIALWIGAFSCLYALYMSYPEPEMALEPAERILALEAERDMLAARLEKRERSLANERDQTNRLSFRVEKGHKDLARVTKEASTYVTAYESLSKQFEEFAIMIRDKDRVIQTQANEIERFEHRVAHAQECLDAKDNLIKRKDLDARAHLRSTFQYANSINQLSEEIATKDDQLWKAAGRYTFADQERSKLKLFMGEGTVESIERRDNTIKQLQQKVQNLNEIVEHDPPGFEKAVNRLLRSRLMDARADLLVYQRQLYERNDCMRLQGKKIDEINSRNLAFQKELGESVSTCASLQKALDASECKSTELQTELQNCTQELTQAIQKKRSHDETCDDRTAKIIALKKAADTHEKANQHLTAKFTKVTTKLQAEKQHILNALTSAQHSLNAANATIHSQDATITRNRTELTKANDRLTEAVTSVGQQTDGDVRASEQLKATQDELAKITAELEVKRGFIDHVTAHAQREIDAKQEALENIKAQLTKQKESHDAITQQLADRGERVAQLETGATKQQEKIDLLIEKWDELEKAHLELQKTCLKLQEQLATADTELAKRRESFKALSQRFSATELALVKEKETSKIIVKQLSRRDERIAQLETRAAEYDKNFTYYKQRVEQLVVFSNGQNENIAAAHKSLQTTSTHCKNAQAQVLWQQDKLNELAAENQKVKAEREELMSHMATVSEALLESDAKNEDLERLARRLGAKVEEWRDEAANLQEEVEVNREEERREGFVNVEEEDLPIDCGFEGGEEEEDEEEFGEFEDEDEEVEILSCPDEPEEDEEEEDFVPVAEADCSYDQDDHQIVEEEVEEETQSLRSLRLNEVDENMMSELEWCGAPPEVGNGQPEPEPDNSTARWFTK